MLKLRFALFVLQPLISTVVADKSNKTMNDIYSKFRQSDYNLTVEWIELIRYTKPELSYAKLTTFKYNRTCPALNFTYTFSVDVGNELEVIIQAYKFASNEYRLFPLRFQVNMCKAIANNMVGASLAMKCGNFKGCPIQKGTYTICNWSLDQSRSPPFLPNGRYMIETQGFYREKELWFTRAYLAVTRSLVKK